MKKKLVYTVVTSTKKAVPKIRHELNIDYYCLTNNPELQLDDWDTKYIKEEHLSNQMFLKKYKILGDLELEKNYDIVIYMDSNLDIDLSLEEIIQKNCNFEESPIYFLEQTNNCTYQMSTQYIHLGFDNPTVIRTQMDYYQRQKFPEFFGFVSDKLIIRKKSKKSNLSQMQETWYQQVEQFSNIEVLSLMYTLWKHQISYGVINKDCTKMELESISEASRKINTFGNGLSSEFGLKEEKNKYEPNNYHCHIEDENDSHSIIARQVKAGSTVLDIGCGVGIIGELLFQNKRCINYGVEIDSTSAELAKNSGYYQKVFNISIENPEERTIIEKERITFDYIILADVLEHMVHPVETLHQLARWLSDDGKIVVSVPNIAYADVIKGLLNFEFNYQKTGILDSTHLHFFTKKSFIEMIANFRITYHENFDIEWIGSTSYKDGEFIFERLLEGENYFIVQNIYELSKLKKDEMPIKLLKELKEQKNNQFQTIEAQIKKYIELEKQHEVIIHGLEEKIKNLEIEINSILQSKSWKITSPLRKISKNLSKK